MMAFWFSLMVLMVDSFTPKKEENAPHVDVTHAFFQLLENFHLVFQRHGPPPPDVSGPGAGCPLPPLSGGNHSRCPSCSRLYYCFSCRCRKPGLRARRPPARPLNLRLVLIFTILLVQHLTSLRSPWEIRKATENRTA